MDVDVHRLEAIAITHQHRHTVPTRNLQNVRENKNQEKLFFQVYQQKKIRKKLKKNIYAKKNKKNLSDETWFSERVFANIITIIARFEEVNKKSFDIKLALPKKFHRESSTTRRVHLTLVA